MSKRTLVCLFLGMALVGCGSTGTEATGSDDDDSVSGPFCSSFQVGAGLICDTTTTPPTLRLNYGTGAGQPVEGNDPRLASINPNKGKFLGTFTPSENQGNPVTTMAPGGKMVGRGGGIVFNQGTATAGVRGASEICAAITNWPGKTAAVPGAHACSQEELINNAHAGNIGIGLNGMAFISTAYDNYSTAMDPSVNNLKASCGNWTYDSGDLFTATTWLVIDQNDKSLFGAGKAITIRFTSSTTADCAAVRPIACCE